MSETRCCFTNGRLSARNLHGIIERGLPFTSADRNRCGSHVARLQGDVGRANVPSHLLSVLDRKSTRLNSSHRTISYAVFCLKKKKHQSSRIRPNPSNGTHP